MFYPEYLSLFSNTGDYTVKVQFKDNAVNVSTQSMDPQEIKSLIDPATGNFYTHLTFDDHPYYVHKYDIDPIKKILTIKVR